jgi:predicted Zn-dependent protease
MRPGDRTTEELIGSVDRGLYITRFYYTRLSHSRGCVMTGMTRDGTFLIENGELTRPVKNLRFTQSYVEALAGCQALSDTSHLNLNEAGVAMHVPAALLESWRFTGQTV